MDRQNRDHMHMKCNNGATCPWFGILNMKDRFINQQKEEYFDRENYTEGILLVLG